MGAGDRKPVQEEEPVEEKKQGWWVRGADGCRRRRGMGAGRRASVGEEAGLVGAGRRASAWARRRGECLLALSIHGALPLSCTGSVRVEVGYIGWLIMGEEQGCI